MRVKFLVIIAAVLVSGCSAAFNGKWDGSGEIGEARFFSFTVDLNAAKPSATFVYSGGQTVTTAVCEVSEQDGRVKFLMDPSRSIDDCSTMVRPFIFVGVFGRDVLTGNVMEQASSGEDRLVGVFRAFRFRKS